MCIEESEECGLARRDFLIGGAGAVAGLVALGAEGVAQNKEQPPTRVLLDQQMRVRCLSTSVTQNLLPRTLSMLGHLCEALASCG